MKQVLAEFLGTMGLLIVVVGSGIMGENLSQGNVAVTLLANSIATGAGLYALIQMFISISGAHFNPMVSLVEWLSKRLSGKMFGLFLGAQVLGAVCGVFLAHFIFGQEIFQLSSHDRGDFRFFASEIIATFGLISIILICGERKSQTVPATVALYIMSAYWCTSSTSFANPAVTIARSLTGTFSGILWSGVLGFIVAQLIGTLIAYWLSRKIFKCS